MIKFKIKITTHNKNWQKDKKHSFMEYEGVFRIIIDSKIFFEDEYFIINEFLRDAISWIENCDKEKNMIYTCIDTEDNPLISFENHNSNWSIRSPWQKYECNILFTREELEKAIHELEKEVDYQIRSYKE